MEQQLNDESSHYEISLTAGQAFVAFVLLLLSLAASFAFGIMVGRGQPPTGIAAPDREPAPVITEKPAIVDVPDTTPSAADTSPATEPENEFVIEPAASTAPPEASAAPAAEPTPVAAAASAPVPHFAQLLSTGDQKTAEALAAKLIDGGFTTAYVERTPGDGGAMIHRVRVRFPSEAAARAAVPRLQGYTKEPIWVTKQQ